MCPVRHVRSVVVFEWLFLFSFLLKSFGRWLWFASFRLVICVWFSSKTLAVKRFSFSFQVPAPPQSLFKNSYSTFPVCLSGQLTQFRVTHFFSFLSSSFGSSAILSFHITSVLSRTRVLAPHNLIFR